MIVQFFRYGNGLSKGPLDYLLGKERDREHAQILSGSEQEVAELIDSSPYAKKYTSGCLSFYEGDLSDEDKTRIMKEFERCLFPGMDESQYRVLWIEHKDKLNPQTGENRLELNFLIPNTEIITGQRLQPFYHQSDLSRVDLFKKVVNFVHDLHDPNDPINKQAITDKKGLPEKTKEIKQEIDIQALIAIEKGLITDRKTMVSWLTDTLGLEIAKVGKKTLTIKHPFDETAPNIRLPGPIYAESFRATEQSAASIEAASREYREAAAERYRDDLQRYEKYLAQKGSELEGKYRLSERGHSDLSHGSDNPSLEQDRGKHQDSEAGADLSHEGTLAATSRPDQEPEITLATVECLEPRSSRTGQYPQNPFEIKYSLDFNSLYSSYFRHCNERNQLREVHSNQRAQSADSSYRQRYSSESPRTNGFIQSDSQRKQESQIEQTDEYASTVINDYRRSAEEARQCFEHYSKTEHDNRTARQLQQRTARESYNFDRLSKEANSSIEQYSISRFVSKGIESITNSIRQSFETLDRLIRHQIISINPDRIIDRNAIQSIQRAIEHSTTEHTATGQASSRTRSEADQAAVNERARSSTEVTATFARFDTAIISKALDLLDHRRELSLQQAQKRDSDYDSPSPF